MSMRYQISLTITKGEGEVLESLRQKGIRVVDVFRRGLEQYEQDLSSANVALWTSKLSKKK